MVVDVDFVVVGFGFNSRFGMANLPSPVQLLCFCLRNIGLMVLVGS